MKLIWAVIPGANGKPHSEFPSFADALYYARAWNEGGTPGHKVRPWGVRRG